MGVKKGLPEIESSLWEKAKAGYPATTALLLQTSSQVQQLHLEPYISVLNH